MITEETLKACEEEAKRFLKRCADLRKTQPKGKIESYCGTFMKPESSALKRSSMDLSRSLSKLRDRNWE